MDFEFFAWGVWTPTFYGNAKFELKIFLEFFNLQITLDSEFFRGALFAPTFFSHAKFEVKNFTEFFLFTGYSGL